MNLDWIAGFSGGGLFGIGQPGSGKAGLAEIRNWLGIVGERDKPPEFVQAGTILPTAVASRIAAGFVSAAIGAVTTAGLTSPRFAAMASGMMPFRLDEPRG